MKIIAHRGNIDGSKLDKENAPLYVDIALISGFDAEVDIWLINDELYLGHDKPKYLINLDWLIQRSDKLWIHCKNTNAVVYFNEIDKNFNYFYHENDLMTLTSKSNMWVFPGNQPICGSIAVLPEINEDDISQCFGICTDYAKKYYNETR